MKPLFSVNDGKPIALGEEVARGGEGAIFRVSTDSALLAKIYLKDPTTEKADKVRAMAAPSGSTDALRKVVAWPLDALADGQRTIRGFNMSRVAARSDTHTLYSPKSRASSFPEADFRFLVHVAANMARAFAVVHSEGHVVGDVNHAQALVGKDGRVVLIDADSFQVRLNGRVFPCDVGTPLFTPPELQDRPFRGLARTPNHDLFGLAVLIFHLLFMGRHPFAGVWSNLGEMTIERAIKDGRFAYGARATSLNTKRPPGTLELNTFGTGIASLFEAAFSNDARPSALTWSYALDALGKTLRQCTVSSAHFYPSPSLHCPWCALEKVTGTRLFGTRITIGAGPVDVGSLWRAVESVPRPANDPALPSEVPWVPPPNAPSEISRSRQVISGVLVLLGFAAFAQSVPLLGMALMVAALFVWPRLSAARKAEIATRRANAAAQWKMLLAKWKAEASVAAFDRLKSDLVSTRAKLLDVPAEKSRRMAKLQQEREQHQRSRYLDRFRIDRSKIPGIGAGRTAILASFGVETADDIDRRIEAISGFGPTLCATLYAWRTMHEGNFRFNPSEPIDPAEVRRVEGDVTALQGAYSAALREGAAHLIRIADDTKLARARLSPLLAAAWNELKLAEREGRQL
ncbi:MAG: hypothetical protein ISS15_11750 [Alphaproteobacteria bacterium]|nr:hypothetical protein [Alphaproteobacteria bacterium]MBL7098326.1 hypothetical protein [Alphaproteobacteria bacterium]